MQNSQNEIPSSEISSHIHWGHFGTIMAALVLLLGVTWLSKPQLFDFKKAQQVSDASVPRYYAYVPAPEDQPQPEVLGASTDQGPEIINDDGTVQPVDMGQVLGASTADVQLSLNNIQVNTVPDSTASIQKYFSDSQNIENGPIDNGAFETALSSNDQDKINQQAQTLIAVRDTLQKLPTPQSLTQLQKLTIIQYNSAIELLQNFTDADNNPQLVGQYLEQFLKSQQDLDTENVAMAQKFGAEDPESDLYLNPDGSSAIAPIASSTSNLSIGVDPTLDNSDISDDGQ
jgi:hypothetical protein